MTDITGNTAITGVIDGAFDLAEVNGDLYDRQWSDRPFGAHTVNDVQFLGLWALQMQQNPPGWWAATPENVVKVLDRIQRYMPGMTVPAQVTTEGAAMFISPFLGGVALAVNHAEWLGRFRDAVKRTAERQVAYDQERMTAQEVA